ncbi:MAG: tRNA adenosine(34) deaminase TadA [Candidatus Aminicenantaceae bacterium]
MVRDEAYYMQLALYEAETAQRKGEVPVGAVVVCGDEVLSSGYNSSVADHDATSHAEIVALRRAGALCQNYRLPDCELFVTLEPCAMCLGAMVQARIRRLVFGALDPKSGAVESIMVFPMEKTNHRMQIKGGVLGAECGKILKAFFKQKR